MGIDPADLPITDLQSDRGDKLPFIENEDSRHAIEECRLRLTESIGRTVLSRDPDEKLRDQSRIIQHLGSGDHLAAAIGMELCIRVEKLQQRSHLSSPAGVHEAG